MEQTTDRLVVLSGRMMAGKDFIAKSAGLEVKGFADPIYQISDYFNGTSDKSVPGVRKFLQQIGQWGWGCVTEEVPHTPERAMVTREIRENGASMTRDFKWVDWTEYGRRRDFWVNITLTRLGLVNTSGSRQLSLFHAPPRREKPYKLAITNSRFEHELNPCRNAGFNHFHVRCLESTRRERMQTAGYRYRAEDDSDVSEAMAKVLDQQMPDERVIWNDNPLAMPEGRRYMTVDEFVAMIEYPGASPDSSRNPGRWMTWQDASRPALETA